MSNVQSKKKKGKKINATSHNQQYILLSSDIVYAPAVAAASEREHILFWRYEGLNSRSSINAASHTPTIAVVRACASMSSEC